MNMREVAWSRGWGTQPVILRFHGPSAPLCPLGPLNNDDDDDDDKHFYGTYSMSKPCHVIKKIIRLHSIDHIPE